MKKLFLLTLTLLSPSLSTAIVDMKNANYADTWIDIEVPGSGYNLKVERTYNSRSLHNGIFGFGWCSDFETQLDVTADGNLVITECGAGLETVYMSKDARAKDVENTVRLIIAKVQEKNSSVTKMYLSDLTTKLRTNRTLRDEMAIEYNIKPDGVKDGIYLANGKGPDTIELKNNFYIRRFPGGESQRFDSKGRLAQIYDRNGNFLKITYQNSGVIRDITDNNGKKLSFKFTSNKKVESITGPNKLRADYKYKNLNDLVSVKNAWKNTFRYEYDSLHNITKITFPDKTFKALKYDTNKDWVVGFRDRDGCTEDYDYEIDKKNPDNYTSTVIKKCSNKVISKGKYEFWYKTNSVKSDKYLARVRTDLNGNVTDVQYHPTLGRPISSTVNGQTTTFAYEESTGLLKTRKEPNRTLSFDYDNSCRKVNLVKEGKATTNFKYDNKCNLVQATNSKGQVVSLNYDGDGRVVSLVDQAKRLIKIQYDKRFGKPRSVERPGVGTLKISYKSNGELNKVDSPSGPTVAVQVAGAFNNLLEVIQPSGIDLGI